VLCQKEVSVKHDVVRTLIHRLEQQLGGIRINRPQMKSAVVAYADDIAIFVTEPE
jgi:hemerythrin-like domain-containing protein